MSGEFAKFLNDQNKEAIDEVRKYLIEVSKQHYTDRLQDIRLTLLTSIGASIASTHIYGNHPDMSEQLARLENLAQWVLTGKEIRK